MRVSDAARAVEDEGHTPLHAVALALAELWHAPGGRLLIGLVVALAMAASALVVTSFHPDPAPVADAEATSTVTG